MENRDYLIILYDYYEGLLKEEDKKYFEDYYFENLSLGEVADNESVSRNAVHKRVKSVETKLLFFEEKLRLYEKDKKLREVIRQISDNKIRKEVEKIFD